MSRSAATRPRDPGLADRLDRTAGPPVRAPRPSALDRSSLAQLTLARVREFVREPEAVFWTFFFPVLLALGLGLAFRGGATEPVTVVVEEGPGAAEVAATLSAADGVRVRVLHPDSAAALLGAGRVMISVRAGPAEVSYRYDPTRPEGEMARMRVDDVLQRAAGRVDPLAVRSEPVQERGGRYIDFLIPGLIGLNLLGTGLWGVGYAVVRMRAGYLLKRFMATPMRRWEFLFSFMLGRLAFLVAELALLLGFARIVFDVRVAGSLFDVLLISVFGAFAFTGLGLLVASRVKTTEGVTGLMNLVAVPLWILSGVFFSTERFPEAMQPWVQALPLTALNDALRAVMNEGSTLAATAGWIGIVLAWGVGCFALAIVLFRWR